MLRKKISLCFIIIAFIIMAISGCTSNPNSPVETSDDLKIIVDKDYEKKNLIGAWKGDSLSGWNDVTFVFHEDGRLTYIKDTKDPWSGRNVILREGQLRADLWDILGINFPTIWGFSVKGDALFLDFDRNSNPVTFIRQ